MIRNARRFATIALCAAVAASSAPAAAYAATGQSATEATMICRPARAGEAPTAVSATGSVELTCRTIAVSMPSADGTMRIIGNVNAKPVSGPDFSKALTPQQMQIACALWLEKLFSVNGVNEN